MNHTQVIHLLATYGVIVQKTTNRFGKVIASIKWQDYLKLRDANLPNEIKIKLV